MKVVIDISNEDYKNLCDSHITYDIKLLSKQSSKDIENTMMILNLIDATKNGTILPDNPTNGDMINALFPNAKDIRVDGGYPLNYIIEGEWHRNLKEWWDAPYNVEDEVNADANSN